MGGGLEFGLKRAGRAVLDLEYDDTEESRTERIVLLERTLGQITEIINEQET